MDFQFVLDEESLMKYLVKYVSKSEKRSDAMTNAVSALGKSAEDEDLDTPAGRKLRSAMIKFLGERDMGVVEMAHSTLGEALCESDLKVVSVALNPGARLRTNSNAENAVGSAEATVKPIMMHYAQRSTQLDMSFNEFARTYSVSRGHLVQHDENIVVRFYPDIHIGSPTAESYARNCELACTRFVPWTTSVNRLLDGMPCLCLC